MFQVGTGNVNGFYMPRSLLKDDFRGVLPDAGWEITYLGQTTYQINMNSHNFDLMLARSPEMAEQMKPLVDRFRTIEPWLTDLRPVLGSAPHRGGLALCAERPVITHDRPETRVITGHSPLRRTAPGAAKSS